MAKAAAPPVIRACILVLCSVLLAGLAAGHSPYMLRSQGLDWIGPDGKSYRLAMLWGDGIFGPDPGRPVVLDSADQVVALGPRVSDGFVHCRAGHDCIVLVVPRPGWGGSEQPFQGAAVAPDPATFRPGRPPDFYPEYEEASYGFKPVALRLADQWVAWTAYLRRNPLIAVPWTLLWAWLGLTCGGILAWGRDIGSVQPIPIAEPLRRVRYAVAWSSRLLAVALVSYVLIAVIWWTHGGFLTLQPVLAAFLAGLAAGLLRGGLGLAPALKDPTGLAAAAKG